MIWCWRIAERAAMATAAGPDAPSTETVNLTRAGATAPWIATTKMAKNMADDLVVREWVKFETDLSTDESIAEHNALARAYLAVVAERDALLEEMRRYLAVIDLPAYSSSWEEGFHDAVRTMETRLAQFAKQVCADAGEER